MNTTNTTILESTDHIEDAEFGEVIEGLRQEAPEPEGDNTEAKGPDDDLEHYDPDADPDDTDSMTLHLARRGEIILGDTGPDDQYDNDEEPLEPEAP